VARRFLKCKIIIILKQYIFSNMVNKLSNSDIILLWNFMNTIYIQVEKKRTEVRGGTDKGPQRNK